MSISRFSEEGKSPSLQLGEEKIFVYPQTLNVFQKQIFTNIVHVHNLVLGPPIKKIKINGQYFCNSEKVKIPHTGDKASLDQCGPRIP